MPKAEGHPGWNVASPVALAATMRTTLIAAVVLTGCTSSPCKQLLSVDDVRDDLDRSLFTSSDATDESCSLMLVDRELRHGFEVQLELDRHRRGSVAANFEYLVEQRRNKADLVPLEGLGDAAFFSPAATAQEPREDPAVVVDQMIQRAAVERSNERVNALVGAAGVDAGRFDAMPETLKRAPRNMGAYLDSLPPRQHLVLFRKGDWTGELSVDKDALGEAQVKQLVQRIAPRLSKLE